MNLFNLFAKLTLDNKDYNKGLDASEKKSSSFASKAGTAFKTVTKVIGAVVGAVSAASAAISKLAVNTINYGDDVDKQSQKLGLSTEAYQKWSYTLQLAGSDISTLTIGMRSLTTFTQKLTEGQGEQLAALEKLGIGYEDFMAMSVEDQFYTLVDSLQGVESQTEKVQLAQEIFGNRTYQELLPLLNQERGSIDEVWQSLDDMNVIMSDDSVKASAKLKDQMTLMKGVFTAIVNNIGTELYPAFEQIIGGLTGITQGSEGATDSLVKGITGVVDKVVDEFPIILDTASSILLDVVDGMLSAISKPEFLTKITNLINSIFQKVVEILPSLVSSVMKIATGLVTMLGDINWGELLVGLLDTIIQVLLDLPTLLSSIYYAFYSIIGELLKQITTGELFAKIGKLGIAIAQALINSMIGAIESGINGILNGLAKALNWIPGVDIKANVSIPKVNWLADGGLMQEIADLAGATLFGVGENGKAEIVAEGRHGTGVANVEQIAEAVEIGEEKQTEAILTAAEYVVNGIVSGLGERLAQQGQSDKPIVLQIGGADFKKFTVKAVNEGLLSQGRKSLTGLTSY